MSVFLEPVSGLLAAPIAAVQDQWLEVIAVTMGGVALAAAVHGIGLLFNRVTSFHIRAYDEDVRRWESQNHLDLDDLRARMGVNELEGTPYEGATPNDWRKFLHEHAEAIKATWPPEDRYKSVESIPPPPKEPPPPRLSPEQTRQIRDTIIIVVALGVLAILLPFAMANVVKFLKLLPPVVGKRCSGALYGACGVYSHGMS